MSNLTIRKKSLNTWLHTDSIFGDFIISKFYFNSFEAKFRIVEEGNSRLVAYEIANITLYDDTAGGAPETFSTITELSLRLEALQYPAFDRTGTTIFPSMEQITNVNVTDIEDNQVLAWDVATSKWVNIAIGGSTSTPTLQEVTEAGDVLLSNDNLRKIVISKEGQSIAFYNRASVDDAWNLIHTYSLNGIDTKSIFYKIGDLDEENSGTGISIDNSESSINFFRNLENFMTFNRDVIGGTNSLGTAWAFNFSELEVPVELKFPNKPNGFYTIATIDDVISSNTTATNGTKYLAVANLTMTDITPPSEGAFYEVTVINGTATIGGVGYTVGQKVFRHFHSGSWRTFVSQNANSLSKIVIKDTSSSAPVTGSTLNTLAKTYEIQGGVFDGNDAFNLEINAEKSSTLGTSTIRVYVNTTNNFATATLYSTTTSSAASIRDMPVLRLRSNFKGTNLIVVTPGATLLSDLGQGFNALRTAIPLNPANTFFVFVAIQNANAGDSTTIESVHLTT